MDKQEIEHSDQNREVKGGMDSKTIATISYITIIGWVVAFVMNQEKKDEFASFHIRQMLGIIIFGVAISVINIIPFLGQLIWLVGFVFLIVLWVMGLMSAVNGTQKTVPVLGEKFQEWFSSI